MKMLRCIPRKRSQCYVCILVLLLHLSRIVNGFNVQSSSAGLRMSERWICRTPCLLRQGRLTFLAFSNIDDDHDGDDNEMKAMRTMKIQDIKLELKQRNVSIQDVFEKEELIRRLLSARKQQAKTSTITNVNSADTTKATTYSASKSILSTQLFLTTMDKGTRIPASNVENGGIIIEPNTQPYVTMKITLPMTKNRDRNNEKATLSLLVDTACSGFVLSPNVISKYQLPSYSTPVTMQGAAGIQQATGLTQIQSFTLFSNDSTGESSTTTFGPLPAAVQDIYGLPSILDGIIGLSFINQFAAMEFDFYKGRIQFYKDADSIPEYTSKAETSTSIIADTNLSLIGSYGIYSVPVYFGGRGPVNMLLDTGASCTLLNWKGIHDLGLSQSSKQIMKIPTPTGAMGSENVAIQLTHRIYVSSTIHIGAMKENNLPGIQLSASSLRLPIDIGRIPIIENLGSNYNIGGILGMDVLIKCRILRLSTRSSSTAKLTLFQ